MTSKFTVGNPVVPNGVYRDSSCYMKLMAHRSLTVSPVSPPYNFCLTLVCFISALPWPLTLCSICCHALLVTFLPSATLPLLDLFVACGEIKPRHFYWTNERCCVFFYLFFISTFKHVHVQNVFFLFNLVTILPVLLHTISSDGLKQQLCCSLLHYMSILHYLY